MQGGEEKQIGEERRIINEKAKRRRCFLRMRQREEDIHSNKSLVRTVSAAVDVFV